MTADQPVVVVARRTALPGRSTEFEEAMRAFIAESASFPGSLEFQLLRPCDPAGDYIVLHRFASPDHRRAFVNSPDYARWMLRLRALTADDPDIREFGGTGGWFIPPAHHAPPPRWRMAAVTFLGVWPLTSTLPGLAASCMPGAHRLLVNTAATAAIVAALTWAVMPALTRLFAPWLFPKPPVNPKEARP